MIHITLGIKVGLYKTDYLQSYLLFWNVYAHSQHFFLKFVLVITYCAPKEKYPSTQSLILHQGKKRGEKKKQKTKTIIELLASLEYNIGLNIYSHKIHGHHPGMDVKSDDNNDTT